MLSTPEPHSREQTKRGPESRPLAAPVVVSFSPPAATKAPSRASGLGAKIGRPGANRSGQCRAGRRDAYRRDGPGQRADKLTRAHSIGCPATFALQIESCTTKGKGRRSLRQQAHNQGIVSI